MQIDRKYRHEYVCCLPKHLESFIMASVCSAISKLGLSKEESKDAIERANSSKVCDLEDTIKIEWR